MELDHYFPFHRLGFTCNPFRALARDELAAVAVIPDEIREAYTRSQDHLQIIGATGRGKSATLLGLSVCDSPQEKNNSYEYLPEGQESFRTDLATLDTFFLDEAQRLNQRSRSQLCTAARSSLRLVFSSHEDISEGFDCQGIQIRTLKTEVLSMSQLEAIVSRRLQHFSLDGDPGVTFAEGTIPYLFNTYGSDIRTILDILYEVFQDRLERGSITPTEIKRSVAAMSSNPP